MNLKNIFSILLLTLLLSCESNEASINSENLLLGSWIMPSYGSETTTYKRGNYLPDEDYGISFSENGEFIERSSGWCGTPPLSYSDYVGSFEVEETLIKITITSYPNSYQWRIISLTENELVVKRELTEQEEEHKYLMDLFDEIEALTYTNSCVDAINWTFTAYGSKACGGFQGYIPYSINIDTDAFLNKVEVYTKAEKEFNIKWGIISDCLVVIEPEGVECINGYPSLTY
jgi:hypothetical protein